MHKEVETLTEEPLNAQTPQAQLCSWITPNTHFFCRNQGAPFREPIDTGEWRLVVDGLVEQRVELSYEELLSMPREVQAAAIECSGNGRALLGRKARGNRWTTGGVGNAVWAGIPLRSLLERAGTGQARHVVLHGAEQPPAREGKPGAVFVRSIPIEKALDSTLLAYEMNGEALPAEHGFPLRAIPLGWTGANCVKWLTRITLSAEPHRGFFMDNVYRIYAEGERPEQGRPVSETPVKSFVTSPSAGTVLRVGRTASILGVAYAGEAAPAEVSVSTDGGERWRRVEFLGPSQRYAWRLWQLTWLPEERGEYRLMSRVTDTRGRVQPMAAGWNVLGYGNNGVREHAVTLSVR